MNTNYPNHVILLCKHGSHLYGTDTPSSDLDLKGVYKADLRDIVLGKDEATIDLSSKSRGSHEKNSKDDIDIQFKELRRFIRDALDGQIYALDLLFAPERFWEGCDNDIWLDILSNREKLLSSNIKPFVGYARQQAAKYGLKGGRLAEVIRFRDWLLQFEPSIKVGEVFDSFEVSEYVRLNHVHLKKQGSDVTYVRVLEKQFQLNHKVGNLAENLSQWIDKYGARSRQAMNNENVDHKAVSHAVRCVLQATELLETGHIELPLKCAPLLLEVKAGLLPYAEVQEILERGMENLEQIKSVLPEKPDRPFWENKILEYYDV